MPKRFPFFKQFDSMDCGPTCLQMVAKYYGKPFPLHYLRDLAYLDREGVSLGGIVEAAEKIGFRCLVTKIPLISEAEDQASLMDAPLPCVAHWRQKHFVVVYKTNEKYIWVADPAKGKMRMTHSEFSKGWISDGNRGVVLLLEATPEFYAQEGVKINKTNFSFLLRYLQPYRKLTVQLILGLLLGSLLQLIFPFLTQAIVDIGIQNQDIDFIWLILMAQLMLFFSQLTVNLIRGWILLHISTRVNVSLISDFLLKLMKLPIGFFDTKMTGDLLQRINDHRRIELFLTGSTLSVIFSAFNIVVFGAVLFYYNVTIFTIFMVASVFYILWIVFFLKKRAEIDYQKFEQLAENQSTLIELIQGMPEIKLQNSERKRRWQWTHIQSRLFQANIRSLKVTQYQDTGANFITQLKDILITVIAATAVIRGEMTLGMMLAVQYIIGQMNAPLQQMIQFFRTAQDAKISLERLGEIHNKEEEQVETTTDFVPETGDIEIENLSFRYNPMNNDVLKNINLTIPRGKVTAIVGTSGSGKTTLVKLMLGFYKPTQGSLKLSGVPIHNILKRIWREQCGAVMQDGFIFSDTIANNVAESDPNGVDKNKLLQAVKTANIQSFIEGMPLGYNTKIGSRGNGISQGQRQRLLIARAVYKDPSFIFLDEATNALDAENEKVIMENMEQFFSGRTVVVVAHRLSTVKNADQIIVLHQGKLIEQGSHSELVAKNGAYFWLVKNQLELGN